jgi:diadenosine tetraphosphatase ApaH/serine/threonine PP2A family protein phosphatase
MRYAIFTDVHANLEALEAVLAKIDALAQQEPIDQIWFLGDLVGYGPNPNECIVKLRERTDVIIAGNHDWAAVGKLDLDDFSEAARLSAEWTAEQLTEEHRAFLTNLPERLNIGECTLVHGSPYGPLWEYLTSEALAERSFQYFDSRYCLVGHTHVPVIFQQADTFANAPTLPLEDAEPALDDTQDASGDPDDIPDEDDEETVRMVAVRPTMQTAQASSQAENAPAVDSLPTPAAEQEPQQDAGTVQDAEDSSAHEAEAASSEDSEATVDEGHEESAESDEDDTASTADAAANGASSTASEVQNIASEEAPEATEVLEVKAEAPIIAEITPEATIASAEDRLNQEIEELLALLGLSQSMIQVTNEMIVPPEGLWQAPENHRAIINPGGVGQPRDGDPRAAFMIYDTERGFTFYRIPYDFEKTQEKIIKAGLPSYLATRLAYGR